MADKTTSSIVIEVPRKDVMTVIEYLGRQRSLGTSYLPPGLKQGLRGPRGFVKKKAAA